LGSSTTTFSGTFFSSGYGLVGSDGCFTVLAGSFGDSFGTSGSLILTWGTGTGFSTGFGFSTAGAGFCYACYAAFFSSSAFLAASLAFYWSCYLIS
jgi:hypothetical protein